MPTASGAGHKVYVQFAKEATAGTAPAAAEVKLEVTDNAPINQNPTAIADDTVSSTRTVEGSPLPGIQDHPTFEFETLLRYEGLQALYRLFLPSYVGGSLTDGQRLHTFKDGAAQNSATFEFCEGDFPATKVTRFLQSYITRIQITGTLTDLLKIRVSGVALSATPTTTPMTAGTLPTVNKGMALHQLLATSGNLKDGSGDTESDILIRSLGITIEIPYTKGRKCAGSRTSLAPLRMKGGSISATLQREFNSTALDRLAVTGTPGALKFLFRDSVLLGAATYRELELSAAALAMTENPRTLDLGDAVLQTATYKVGWDPSTASGLVLVARNADAVLS